MKNKTIIMVAVFSFLSLMVAASQSKNEEIIDLGSRMSESDIRNSPAGIIFLARQKKAELRKRALYVAAVKESMNRFSRCKTLFN